jgi:hypothetical protein
LAVKSVVTTLPLRASSASPTSIIEIPSRVAVSLST